MFFQPDFCINSSVLNFLFIGAVDFELSEFVYHHHSVQMQIL